ncbi:hypothetical protein [Sphaerospermopsis aphanizomenoides]|uniref:hypothetical protein n=1 Tax=Sphaerospermopsis aphanizomenoides TaxID=459663 RepID=UPI0018809DFB|nr:hypothetical protein [Sphaerospermopsis aphanizomenoides]
MSIGVVNYCTLVKGCWGDSETLLQADRSFSISRKDAKMERKSFGKVVTLLNC